MAHGAKVNDYEESLRLANVPDDPYDPRNPDRVKHSNEGPSLSRLLGGFKDLGTIGPRVLQLDEGNYMLSNIDLDTESQTLEILRVHMLKIALTFIIFIHIRVLGLGEVIQRAVFALHIAKFSILANIAKNEQGGRWRLTDRTVRLYHSILIAPNIAYSVLFNLFMCYSPCSIREFAQSMPPENSLPRSIALITKMNDLTLEPPPEIPQPYLDADKTIQVPSKREVQNVLSLRNEYFTQRSAFFATEKMRLLSEISRFVCWSALLPTVSSLNVHEDLCGPKSREDASAVLDHLTIIGTLILNEFHGFTKSSYPEELSVFPAIELVDVKSNISFKVAHPAPEKEVESPSSHISQGESASASSYKTNRALVVYFSERDSANEQRATDNGNYPPITDLTLIANTRGRNSFQTLGYLVSDHNDRPVESIIYADGEQYGFKLFFKALYFYAMKRQKDEKLSFRHSGLLPGSTESTASQEKPSKHYLIAFLDGLRRLRPFDLNSSPASLWRGVTHEHED